MIRETFEAGGETATATVQVVPSIVELSVEDMADPSPVLAAIPSGTADHIVEVRLPAGEFWTDLSVVVEGKQFWHLVGGPTTFRFPTYGPLVRDMYDRRHMWVRSSAHVTVEDVKIWGPHSVRSSEPTRAAYVVDKAFQHGIAVTDSHHITLRNIEAYEVGGDGLYLARDCWDIEVDGYRVEYNGRQGFAGIGGGRWHISRLYVVHSGRFSLDLEPIGTNPDGTRRSVDHVVFHDCVLFGGIGGIVLHRVSDITIEECLLSRGINISGTSYTHPISRRGIRILNNVWPDPIASDSSNAPAIKVSSVDGLEVRGNYAVRDSANTHTRNSAFVEVVALPVSGHFIVKDNQLANWAAAFRFHSSLDPAGYADVTVDTGV